MGTLLQDLQRSLRRLGSSRTARRIEFIKAEVVSLRRQMAAMADLMGGLECRRVAALPDRSPLRDVEFRVHSQFGDDGVIQYLFSRIPAVRSFVEFGVEDYTEANTRFLLVHDDWRGLILDGRPDLDAVVSAQGLPMLHDLEIRSAFITAENINELLLGAGFSGEIGLLSIDIDGNDYWVWKAITCVDPQVVVVEYNAVFGPDRALTIPYDPAFTRQAAHHSWLYFGASLGALCRLAETRGYAFVGCTSAGNNAYFVRKDLAAPFRVLTAEEGFVDSRFRESRDEQGRMDRLKGSARLAAIAHLPVLDLETGSIHPLKELVP
jgi:hypothetical protein